MVPNVVFKTHYSPSVVHRLFYELFLYKLLQNVIIAVVLYCVCVSEVIC